MVLGNADERATITRNEGPVLMKLVENREHCSGEQAGRESIT